MTDWPAIPKPNSYLEEHAPGVEEAEGEQHEPETDSAPAAHYGLEPMWLAEPTDDEAPDDPDAIDPADIVPASETFWASREELQTIYAWAKAKMASPHAVLAAALAEVVAATPYHVCIPPTIHGPASLNLFIGLVGESGAGKGGAPKVARRAVATDPDMDILRTAPKSGEAFASMFATAAKDGASDSERVRHNAIAFLDEIDILTGVRARQGSTIMPVLRSVAMGEFLGGHAADAARRVAVQPLTYRCCFMAGIQPSRSDVIFGDSDGGTPQRFLFVSANDPECLLDPPEAPLPFVWQAPDWSLAPSERDSSVGATLTYMKLPDAAIAETKRIAWEKERGLTDPLDGHRNLLRLKISGALAILAGRTYVTTDDWELSTYLMDHSDGQRNRCLEAISNDRRKSVRVAGMMDAERELAKSQAFSETVIPKVQRRLLNLLSAVDEEGAALGTLKKSITAGQRDHAEEALELLVKAGEVEHFERSDRANRPGDYFRLARSQ